MLLLNKTICMIETSNQNKTGYPETETNFILNYMGMI